MQSGTLDCVPASVAQCPFGPLFLSLCVLHVEPCNGFAARRKPCAGKPNLHLLETHQLYSRLISCTRKISALHLEFKCVFVGLYSFEGIGRCGKPLLEALACGLTQRCSSALEERWRDSQVRARPLASNIGQYGWRGTVCSLEKVSQCTLWAGSCGLAKLPN